MTLDDRAPNPSKALREGDADRQQLMDVQG